MAWYGSLDDISDTSPTMPGKVRSIPRGKAKPNMIREKPKIPGKSVGVSYDINNQPISVNTFGSVMPDVTSEVDLATTSETDVESNKKYVPNILEKALERTICYHPRRRAKASLLTIGLLCILTILFNAGVLLVSPIYTSSMRKAGGDEMVALLSLTLVIPVPQIILSLLLKHTYDKTITLKPTAPLPLYTIMGLCFALRYNMGMFASRPHRTPHSLQPGLSSVMILFSVLVSFIMLKKGFSKRRLVCCVVALCAVFISVEPRIWSLQGSENGDLFYSHDLVEKIVWPIIFTMSFLPLVVYNVAAEKELRKNVIHSFSLSTSGILAGCVFTILMFGTNFIPWYGNVTDFPHLWQHLKSGFLCNFSYSPECHHCLIKVIILSSSMACYNIFSLLLVAASEGSVFASLVSSLSVPLATVVWTLFHYDYDSDQLYWRPAWSHTSAFAIGSAALLLPSVITYNVFAVRDAKEIKKEEKGCSDVSSSEYEWD